MTSRRVQWHHNEYDGVSNHQCLHCLLNRLFRRRSKKASKLRVTGLCEGNSPVTGGFPSQRASNAENISIWWLHHDVWFIWARCGAEFCALSKTKGLIKWYVYLVLMKRMPIWSSTHGDVIKWKHFPRYLPFVRGIQRSPVNSPHKGQWRGALMFSLICVWINGWVNDREAGDLRPIMTSL